MKKINDTKFIGLLVLSLLMLTAFSLLIKTKLENTNLKFTISVLENEKANSSNYAKTTFNELEKLKEQNEQLQKGLDFERIVNEHSNEVIVTTRLDVVQAYENYVKALYPDNTYIDVSELEPIVYEDWYTTFDHPDSDVGFIVFEHEGYYSIILKSKSIKEDSASGTVDRCIVFRDGYVVYAPNVNK